MGVASAGLLADPLLRAAPLLAGFLFVLAGAYQLTGWKHACLARCRSPAGFLMTEWRDGAGGALIMGAQHGLNCLGCCWALMLLLFAAGAMNLLWIAILAAYVLLERLLPAGRAVSRVVGLVAIGWGGWLISQTIGG